MGLMKKLLLCFLLLIAKEAFSCRCGITPFPEKYQSSEFIATVKILHVIPDAKNEDYHDIDFELINLYKGASVSKLKILSMLNSSCSFLPAENTTWLVFASINDSGFLSFGFCSGSQQLDRKFNLVKYPNLDVRYKRSIDLKLEVLAYLKEHKIAVDNKFKLLLNDHNICSEDLKGLNEKRRFSVYEIEVDQGLSIDNVRVLRKFKNDDLSKRITLCLRKNVKVNFSEVDVIPEKTKIITIYFYYPADKGNPSFVSTWDL
jgi:hypothetical protein